MAYVSNLFIAVERRKPMKPVDEAIAITDRGFAGCLHARQGSKRQLLLIDRETLAEFDLAPGIVRENITTAGLNVAELEMGHRLALGGAVLEVTIPCEPCSRMEEIRAGLQEGLKDRRGVLCRVVEGGRISRGDVIEVRNAAAILSAGGTVERKRGVQRKTLGRHHHGFGQRSSDHDRVSKNAGEVFDSL